MTQLIAAPMMVDNCHLIDALAVEYILSGERTAGAVARGESQLRGARVYSSDGTTVCAPGNPLAVIEALGTCPRIYDDAVLARVVEKRYGLPTVEEFEDIRIMSRLLQDSEAEEAISSPNSAWDGENDPDAGLRCCQPIFRKFEKLFPLISHHGLASTYSGIECPLVDSVAKMIDVGVQVDTNMLEEIKQSTSQQLDILRGQIRQIVGSNLNPEAEEKVCEFLFGRCRLPVIALTENENPSTSAAVLGRLADRHPVIPCIIEYRRLRPIYSAANSLLEHVSSDSTIHANLDALGCVTGRFNCESPNLQGMPRPVLEAVRAREGHTLVEIDISQAELRVLAHFTQDPRLVEAYTTEQVDLHARTAAVVLGLPELQITPQQRADFGKCVNFAVIYGKTEYGLAADLGVSLEQAGKFIQVYFRGYPSVKRWIDHVRAEASQGLEVRTLHGRRRLLPDFRSCNDKLIRKSERRAVNTIIQGTAADLLKLTIMRLDRAMPQDCRLLLTVHDSFLFEVPTEILGDVVAKLQAIVEEPSPDFSIPIVAEAKAGTSWLECK